MIVSFDISPDLQVSNYDALYANFLRCVTAIATAAAGTTSLTVNPYTSTSGTDGTRNCIRSIIANSEAGGWTTSSTHNIPSYPSSFTAMSSLASYANMYKADFYNLSGKGTMPYNKFTIHAPGHNTTGTDEYGHNINQSLLSTWTQGFGLIQQTFGCSSTTAGDANYTPTWSGVNPNQQPASFTNNGYYSTQGYSGNGTYYTYQSYYPGNEAGFCLQNYGSVYYTMAVTANYCIIWEVHRSNSYSAGYNNTFTSPSGNASRFGTMMYGGLRTTQPWEDALGFNPPWTAFTVHHVQNSSNPPFLNFTGSQPSYTSYFYYNPQPPNCAAAYMATVNNSGVITSTATNYRNKPYTQHWLNHTASMCVVSGSGHSTAAGILDYSNKQSDYVGNYSNLNAALPLVTPMFHQRQRRTNSNTGVSSGTHNPNLPTVDPVTGTFVPGAYPITFARTTNDQWNPGGIAKGIYKSLTMSLANMKLYWSEGQTFNIGSDIYMPVVFNEDMYLIRFA